MDSVTAAVEQSHLFASLVVYILGGALGLLLVLLAWIGNRLHNRLDDINTCLQAIEGDLRDSIEEVKERLSFLEGKHGGKGCPLIYHQE